MVYLALPCLQFQGIADQLFQSFNSSISITSFDTLSSCIISWLEEYCKPQVGYQWSPVVLDSFQVETALLGGQLLPEAELFTVIPHAILYSPTDSDCVYLVVCMAHPSMCDMGKHMKNSNWVSVFPHILTQTMRELVIGNLQRVNALNFPLPPSTQQTKDSLP